MLMPPPPYPRDEPGRYAPSPQVQSPHGPPPPGYGPPGGGYGPPGPYGIAPQHVQLHHPPSDPLAMQPVPPNYMGLSLPHDASSTLYVEGLPPDASEREVAHIFRRYEGLGFQSIRMRGIESNKNPGTSLFLCFAEFDNPHQATLAMYGLQGYRFDPVNRDKDTSIKISYAKSKTSRGPPSGGGGGRGGGGGALPPPHPSYNDRPPPRDDRYDDDRRMDDDRRGSSYHDDDRRMSDDDRGRGGYRRDTREHADGYRDEYEDSERGDDDVFQRADQVSFHGISD